jgi:hypothetical protein
MYQLTEWKTQLMQLSEDDYTVVETCSIMKVSNSISKAWQRVYGSKINIYTNEQDHWHVAYKWQANGQLQHNKMLQCMLQKNGLDPRYYPFISTVLVVCSTSSKQSVDSDYSSHKPWSRWQGRMSLESIYTFPSNPIQNASDSMRWIGLPNHLSLHNWCSYQFHAYLEFLIYSAYKL